MINSSVEAIERLDAPWRDGRPPIHQLVVEALARQGAAEAELWIVLSPRERNDKRPWDPADYEPDRLKAAAGMLAAAINLTLRTPLRENASQLYKILQEARTISIVEEMVSRVADAVEDRGALAALSRRLILESPDYEAVVAGIAFLGASGKPDDAELITTIGRYEDLTLYSVEALRNLLPEPEYAIWSLAKNVYGGGRVDAIEHLTGTENADVKAWILRDGFRVGTDYDDLAYVCATAGDLRGMISGAVPDEDLLIAAGEILSILIENERAKSIEDYAAGPAACRAFLRHVAAQLPRDARVIEAVLLMKSLSEGDRAERLRGVRGWDGRTVLEIRSLASAILQRPEAKAIVEEGLASGDRRTFNTAAHVAPHFGIDPWPRRLERQRSRRLGQWFWLMQTPDPARIDQVLELARAQLNLEAIGSGPTATQELGDDFEDDRALQFVLQGLKRFPGKGWDLLKIGLRGRGSSARGTVVNVLDHWGPKAWPPDALKKLRCAAEREPIEGVSSRLHDLISMAETTESRPT